LAGIQLLHDDKKFDPNRIDQTRQARCRREWTIVNTHEHDDHVFHIHTNRSRSCRLTAAVAVPEWRDSVIVQRKGGKSLSAHAFWIIPASTWSIAT